jgi:hypothetical protein
MKPHLSPICTRQPVGRGQNPPIGAASWKRGARAYFAGANFTGTNFSGTNFLGAQFPCANSAGIQFPCANSAGSNLPGMGDGV